MPQRVSSFGLLILFAAANPDWPPTDPGLSPDELARPQRWPDDPGYGPGPDCRGQWGFFSFTPSCATALSDRTAGVGARVDRAWLWTIGRPQTVIATLDGGPDPADLDLITQWRLNPGELDPPDGAAVHDANGDGAFDVRDYTSATSTEAPTLDTIRAADLLARPDGGDTNGNGLLDPQDILQIYADGQDRDQNGYIDDICGWDFIDDDPDPFGETFGQGHERGDPFGPAHWALARANDGVGLAGACPGCRGWPLRVAEQGATEPAALALAVLFAADHGAKVAMIDAATWGVRPELHAAIDYAETRGMLVTVGRGRHPGRVSPVAFRDDRVLEVGGVSPNADDFSSATRFDAPDPCAGLAPVVAAPGRCDEAGLGLTAGVAALVWTAAAGLPAAGRTPWAIPPAPATVRAILASTARVVVGAPPIIDARAAVDATLDRLVPTAATILSPTPDAVWDPSRAEPIPFRARLTDARDQAVAWRLEAAANPGPNFVLIESGRIEPGQPPDITVDVPSVGWTSDPTAPPRRTGAFALVLRLTTRTTYGDQTVPLRLDRTVHVHRDVTLLPAFPLELSSGVTGAVRIVELEPGRTAAILSTEDGRLLAVTATGGVQVLARAPRWPPLSEGPNGHGRAPALTASVGHAWSDALAAGATARRFDSPDQLWALSRSGMWLQRRFSGEVRVGPPAAGPGRGWQPIALDDGMDAYYIDAQSRLHAVDADGIIRPGFPVPLDAGSGPPAVGDVDDDGRPDIFVAGPDRVWRIQPDGLAHPDGPFALGWPVELPESEAPAPYGLRIGPGPSVTIADIDDDRKMDIVVAVPGQPVLILDIEGQPKAVGPSDDLGLTGAAAVGPLDDPEIPWALLAVGRPAAPGMGAAQAAGAFVGPSLEAPPAYPVPWTTVPPLEPVLIDVDGDNRAEALWPDGPDRLRALDRDGNPPKGWPKLTGDAIAGAPAVGDLDGDGRREVVVATRRGWVFAWRTSAETIDAAPWDGHRHDVRASGDLRSPTRPVPSGADGCDCRTARGPSDGAPWLGLAVLMLGFLRARSCPAGRRR